MPKVAVNIEIYCSCGEGLCNQTHGGNDNRGNPSFIIDPCEKCLDEAENTGYGKGYKERSKESE